MYYRCSLATPKDMAWHWIFVLIVFVLSTNGEYIEPGPKYRCPKTGSSSELALHPCRCVADSDNGLALHCENSNLATLSVGLSNVASLGDVIVDNLTISSCNIGNRTIYLTFHKHKRNLGD